jgi:ubiquinone biosynthesis protein UbiJ
MDPRGHVEQRRALLFLVHDRRAPASSPRKDMEPRSPELILESVLPTLLQRSAQLLGTTIQWVVLGRAPQHFVYTFSEDGLAVSRGISDASTLTLAMDARALASLLDSTLDVEDAMRAQRVKVIGDAQVLLDLVTALGDVS